MTVIDSFDAFSLSPEQAEAPELFRRWQREAAERILAAAKEVAKVGGVDFSTVQVQDQDPYEAIVRSAQELNCDLIAMASHGRRGIAAIVLGSVTTKVLTHSTIPVLVIRSPPAGKFGLTTTLMG